MPEGKGEASILGLLASGVTAADGSRPGGAPGDSVCMPAGLDEDDELPEELDLSTLIGLPGTLTFAASSGPANGVTGAGMSKPGGGGGGKTAPARGARRSFV